MTIKAKAQKAKAKAAAINAAIEPYVDEQLSKASASRYTILYILVAVTVVTIVAAVVF